jgi:hypothetical protein
MAWSGLRRARRRRLHPRFAVSQIVQSLDDHYNEHSQLPGYAELNVVGVQLDDVSLAPFSELSFSEFVRTPTGFIAKKFAPNGDGSICRKAEAE